MDQTVWLTTLQSINSNYGDFITLIVVIIPIALAISITISITHTILREFYYLIFYKDRIN